MERYNKRDPKKPNRRLGDKIGSQLKECRESVLKLEDKHPLPTNRETINKSLNQHLPFHLMAKPTIREDLTTNTNKKDGDIIQPMAAAQKTIYTYSDELIHITTDGSVFNITHKESWLWARNPLS